MATTVFAVLTAGLAVLTAVRWWQRPLDGLGRRRSFPWTSTALLLAAAGLAAVPLLLHARLERTLGAVASALVGAEVEIRCQTPSEAMFDAGAEYGFVPFDDAGRPLPWAVIKTEQCGHLEGFLSSRGTRLTDDQVVAVHVLTHEAMHLAGIADEAAAECAAVQRDTETARRLGALEHNAREVARRYWTERYPRMPDGYWSRECRRGGALDERLPGSPW